MSGDVMTSDELRRCFPGTELVLVPSASLPAGVQEPGLRRVLCDVGVPEAIGEVVEFYVDLASGVETVEAVYERLDGQPPDGVADLYFVGAVAEAMLCVHGTTGAVFRVSDDAVEPLATGLPQFLRVLCAIEREVAEGSGRRADRTRRHVLDERKRLDPGATAPMSEASWERIIDRALDESG